MTVEVVVTAAAGPLRRSLGPTAWMLFEHLTAEAGDDGGVRAAYTNVRRLAAELGVGRDAAASAVQALAVAGCLRIESTRSGSGRFATCRYVVAAVPALRRLDAPAAPERALMPIPVRRRARAGLDQLTLLDAPDDNTQPTLTAEHNDAADHLTTTSTPDPTSRSTKR